MGWDLVGAIVCSIGLLGVIVLWRYALHRPRRSGMMMHDLENGTVKPVEETKGGKLYSIIAEPRCPDCDSRRGFYQGPSGGLSVNIFCINRECRAGFNVTPVISIAERIHKADIERYP